MCRPEFRVPPTDVGSSFAPGKGLFAAAPVSNWQPRKDLEARELYAAGARHGGLLARQTGEAMSSYVLRRRTWWSHLQQLDDSIQVSEGILAEQMLQNSGLTDDQKLMIRTTLHGKLTVDKVGNELLNQRLRIQDRERHLPRRGFNSFRDHKKDWKGRNR